MTVGLKEIGIDRIGEQWHVAEDIVEDVRLLKIVEFVFGPDKGRGGEAAVRQMLEESVVGDEPSDRHHAPAGDCSQALAQIGKVGNAEPRKFKPCHGSKSLFASAPRQQRRLTREEAVPAVVLLFCVGWPVLRNRPVGVAGIGSVPVLWNRRFDVCSGQHGFISVVRRKAVLSNLAGC